MNEYLNPDRGARTNPKRTIPAPVDPSVCSGYNGPVIGNLRADKDGAHMKIKPLVRTALPGLALQLLLCSLAHGADLPAFPGAEGFGAGSRGGRGGKVFVVRTLEDYKRGGKQVIAGSLREACEAEGPRIIVFDVAGTIELKSALVLSKPFVTIAGQTAPGGGICLKNYGLKIVTHDVVVRYLRVRPGDTMKSELDSISVSAGSRDVIIDHCSASWSIDETLSVSGAGISNVTVQWCIISESLNDSFHKKGPHGYGSLVRTNGNISFHHNLYAHHRSRSPRPGTYGDGSILFDFRNNVIYQGGRGYTSKDPARVNYVANYIKATDIFSATKTTEMHSAGNLVEGKKGGEADPWSAVKGLEKKNRRAAPFPVAPVATDDARSAYRRVLYEAGASKPVRDAVDARIIEQVRSGKGRLIDSQKQVGGWPKLEPSYRDEEDKEWITWLRRDADGDGMRTNWERAYGLRPRSDSDTAEDPDGDGYTNIEECLNGTHPRVKEGAAARELELKVRAIPDELRRRLKLKPFYQKVLSLGAFPVVSSEKVSDYALLEAGYLIHQMLEGRDDILDAMARNKIRFTIMACDEFTTQVPEHSDLEPPKFWDKRARGLGATHGRPSVSCGEENLLRIDGDPYRAENILVHEFAHAMHNTGLDLVDPSFDGRLKAAYQAAMKKGLWKTKYAANNHHEYWAEGVQSWFNTNRPPDHDHNHVDNREELIEYDPGLAAIIREIFGYGEWRYSNPGDRDKPGHLAGYKVDPQKRFEWPAALVEGYKEYEKEQREKKKKKEAGKKKDG